MATVKTYKGGDDDFPSLGEAKLVRWEDMVYDEFDPDVTEITSPTTKHTHDGCAYDCGGRAVSGNHCYEVSEKDALNWFHRDAPSGLQNLIKLVKGNRKGWQIANDHVRYISLCECLESLKRPLHLTYCNKHGCGQVVDRRKIIQHLEQAHRIEREVKLIKCRHCGEEVDDIVSHLKDKNCAHKVASGKPQRTNVKPRERFTTTNGKTPQRTKPTQRQGLPSWQCEYCRYWQQGTVSKTSHLKRYNCKWKHEQSLHEAEEAEREQEAHRTATKGKPRESFATTKGKPTHGNPNKFAALKRKTSA